MTIFNQDDILSLEAPGAQVQLIGNLRAVLFLGLPGEECHYTIRVGSEDFAFVSHEVPTVSMFLAAGNAKEGYTYGQHHPKVRFDDSILYRGTAAYTYMALRWLAEHQ